MAYSTAYTARFTSIDGVQWGVDIDIDDSTITSTEIILDRDEPVTIEWPETTLGDAVQPSLCTVKVVNDTDRQMVPLMLGNARCSVFRWGELYWRGLIDDSVYEEPYSYQNSYVTEITFSDLGILRRREFIPGGIMTLRDIVGGMAEQAGLSLANISLIPLHTPEGNIVSLWGLSVNSLRFDGMKQMEVLDGILRSLNLRVIQLRGELVVYAVEALQDNALLPVFPMAWKGTDARMRGGETFGRYELSFEHDAKPVIADGAMDPEQSGWLTDPSDWFVEWYGDSSQYVQKAFHIWWGRHYGTSNTNKPRLAPHSPALYILTRSAIEDSDCAFVALNAYAKRIEEVSGAAFSHTWTLNTPGVFSWRDAGELMSVLSRSLPSEDGFRDYEIRVNLDLLLSPKFNPFDTEEHGNYPTVPAADSYDWKHWKKHITMVLVPVKLELLDGDGDAVMHFSNAEPSPGQQVHSLLTLGCGHGEWVDGPASWCDMVLAYYKDGCSETAFIDNWATNRPTLFLNPEPQLQLKEPVGLLAKREQGEYVPMPPLPGTLRLTVSDAINGDPGTFLHLQSFDPELGMLNWKGYRNPKLTIVRKNRVDDSVATEDVKEEDVPGTLLDTFNESFPVGSRGKGVSPASLGLLLYPDGDAVGKLVRNGVADTLMRHRLHALEDQFLGDHTVLSGTAELNPIPLLPRSDASTPGVFLATAIRQNPIEDTEEITMAKVAEANPRYAVQWGGPVCATREESYAHRWSNPVCVPVEEHYGHAWGDPVCARTRVTPGPVWHEMTED